MFSISLYQMKSPPNKIEKDISFLIQTVQGSLRNGSSIIDPVIVVETDSNTLWRRGLNYAYIEEFGRYYYVTNIVSIPGTLARTTSNVYLWELHMHVDVLMSFKDEILSQKAIIARQEAKYNLYLDDGVFMTYQNPKIQTKLFSVEGPFETQEFVLVVAGS